jgi:hypothetical protein
MKIYKWLRGLMKASALTTVMFIMQACYGVPSTNQCEFILSGYVTDKVTGQPLEGIKLSARNLDTNYDYVTAQTDSTGYFEILQWGNCRNGASFNLKANDADGYYMLVDTVLFSDSDLNALEIKLEGNQ